MSPRAETPRDGRRPDGGHPPLPGDTIRGLRIDRSVSLRRQPEVGHNRWHPDIPAALSIPPGETIELDTRDALDGQVNPDTTATDLLDLDLGRLHPLTGPVEVKGALPGDLLVVTIHSVRPTPHGFTLHVPGFGFLRHRGFPPFLAHWDNDNEFAVSEQLPGIRLSGRPFLGVMGVAPSRELMTAATQRERTLKASGFDVDLPDPAGAVPAGRKVAQEGLRTAPPRENGGNLDIAQLTAGTRLELPVFVPGGRFSVGDGHFTQGDGEVCGTAIEVGTTSLLTFELRPGAARKRGLERPHFTRPPTPPQGPSFVTTGLPLGPDGENHSEDLTMAARDAVEQMIDHLVAEYGYGTEQAYAICSVAVDLRVAQAVDLPNVLVTAHLPLDIFTS